MSIEAFFIVVKGTDGSLVTYTEIPEEGLTSERKATTEDMFLCSKQIVDEIEKNDLAMRVASIVVSQLKATAPNVSETIADALKQRGIDPTSVSPTE